MFLSQFRKLMRQIVTHRKIFVSGKYGVGVTPLPEDGGGDKKFLEQLQLASSVPGFDWCVERYAKSPRHSAGALYAIDGWLDFRDCVGGNLFPVVTTIVIGRPSVGVIDVKLTDELVVTQAQVLGIVLHPFTALRFRSLEHNAHIVGGASVVRHALNDNIRDSFLSHNIPPYWWTDTRPAYN
jgi:hypothetical protein